MIQEIKFGYSITGIIEPNKVITNSGSKKGDVLILTKPIGTGVISTGIKFEKASETAKEAALKTMTTSAREASKVMQKNGANACTDITGFGLLGHAFEMAKASKVTFKIESKEVPLLPEVLELIEQKMLTRGDKNNREYVGETVNISETSFKGNAERVVRSADRRRFVNKCRRRKGGFYLNEIEGAKIIGRVKEYSEFLIEVE